MINAQSMSSGGANVVLRHSISSELAQKMVDEAVVKAREIGIAENVAILVTGQSQGIQPDGWGPDPLHRDCAE
jgi:hypothetical protein